VSAELRRQAQRGLSLVELMIGLTLGLVMVAVVIQGYASSSNTASVNSLVSEFQTNGRYAIEFLRREVRHSALSPLVWDASQIDINATAAAKNYGCGAGLTTQLRQGLLAANDSNPYAASCLANGTDRKWARGDVLTLRRLGLDAVTSYSTGAPYARVSYGAANVFLGGETATTLPAPAYDYPLVSDVYFINEFSTSASESPKVPALYRLTLGTGANPTLAPELVASNVEHMQMQFGVADGSGNIRFLNADTVSDWTAVVSMRLWLLMRATSPEAGFASGSYTMGDVTYTPADNYRRVVLASTIDLRNR
jgi:type IV pilus assembly protein PilW